MSPKQKALELNNIYRSYLPSNLTPELLKALGVKLALICVDQILRAREAGNTGVVFDEEYWKEVESELKNT